MCNKTNLIFEYNDRHTHVWVNTLIDSWIHTEQNPVVGLASFIRNKYDVYAESISSHRILIMFDREADATAFILKLS